MALDHALALDLGPKEAVLRTYGWEVPTVSFGRNEPAEGRFDRDVACSEGIRFVRRPTGGRAVLHDDELTYAVALPLDACGGLRASYVRVNEGLLLGLRELGVGARIENRGEALAPDAGPCFARPAKGEVMLDGRKLIGSAQARVGRCLLQHGSILIGGDQSRLGVLARRPDWTAGEPPATLSEEVGRLDPDVLASALAQGLEAVLGGRWGEGGHPAEVRGRAEALESDRYGTEEWTWRR